MSSSLSHILLCAVHISHAHPAFVSWLIFMTVFHTMSLFFHFLDIQALLHRYKIYRPTPHTPTYTQMLPRVLFNQVCILLPTMLFCHRLHLSHIVHPNPVSTPKSVLAMLTVVPFLHELAFYFAHRYILHSRWGFNRLNHALHHTSKAHSAVSAMYMSSLDFVLEIILPYLLPLIVTSRANYVSHFHLLLMLPFGALGGTYEHSGYNFFPNLPVLDTRVHGLHHLFYNCSFADGVGAPSVLDPTFGTVCASVGPVPHASRSVFKWILRDPKSHDSAQNHPEHVLQTSALARAPSLKSS